MATTVCVFLCLRGITMASEVTRCQLGRERAKMDELDSSAKVTGSTEASITVHGFHVCCGCRLYFLLLIHLFPV